MRIVRTLPNFNGGRFTFGNCVKKILTFRGWTPVVTVCTAALFVSACSPLGGTCLLCPTDKPFEGALPAQGPTVRAEITRISVWDTTCNSWGCGGRPEVAPDSAGTYALRLGEPYYLEIVVHHPGVQYRELSIQLSQSWGYPGDLVNTVAEREDQVLLSSHVRELETVGRLPTAVGVFNLHVRVEERGRDLPTPILLERDLIIRPLP
jgi:hypothetical protein